jgi:hypothetical protein
VRRGDADRARGEGEKGRRRRNGYLGGTTVSASSNLSKNQRERLEKRIGDIEKQIAAAEDEVAKLSAEMSLPEVIADYAKFQEVSGIAEAKQAKIQSLYEEWEAASAEL